MTKKNNRGLKTRTPLSNNIDIELDRAFSELNKKTRIPKSKLLDEAIMLLLAFHQLNEKTGIPTTRLLEEAIMLLTEKYGLDNTKSPQPHD